MPVKLYEGDKNETGGTGIEVTDNKVINLILRSLNNLIKVNDNNEVYVDLQLEDGLENSDSLPIGVNVGRVVQADGRPVTGTLISGQTTSGDRVKVLYGDDGKIRVDNGTGEWKILQYELNAGPGIGIGDYSSMQGPAPAGYHVPSKDENVALVSAMTALGIDTSNGNCMKTYMKMPFAGYRNISSGDVSDQGTDAFYWSSIAYNTYAYNLDFNSAGFIPNDDNNRSFGFSVRAFKNTSVTPDGNWTILFDGSGIATGAGIFHNITDGLISISSNGQNWITIQDKNLGATQVYNDGDVLSETNCGNYYQRGNNYGFAWTGTITTSSTQVDASNYGPGNSYSSNTFIFGNNDWSSVQNDNLWGGEDNETIENIIINTGVLSVDGKTGHVHVEQPNVCEITVQLVDTDYIGTATKIGDLVDGATIIGHSNGLQGLQGLSIAGVSYAVINGIDALDNWTHFYGIYREGYGVIIYSFNNN